MRDNRSFIIKQLLKKYYPNAKFEIRISKYSMGESINIRTNAFKIDQVPDPRGYGFINQASEQDATTRTHIKGLLTGFENIDRDPGTGEVLCGGNTFLFLSDF